MPPLPDWAWWTLRVAAGVALFVAALPWLAHPALRGLLAPRYRFRVAGREHVPAAGPALLAVNHVTWIDGFLLAAASPREVKALVNASYIDLPGLRRLARRVGLIPVPAKGPRAQRAAIEAVRQAFDRGEVVLIFPEAQLSRTGLLGPFYRGLEVMMKGREAVPVLPVYLDNLWGSLFSHSGDRFFLKWPQGPRRKVIVAIGAPVPPPVTAFDVRQAVQVMSVRAAELRAGIEPPPQPLETFDLTLPHWAHPELGLLAASTADFDRGGIHQTGHKPGTVGQAPPGVALRAVDASGRPLPPDAIGRLQALLPGRPGWTDTSARGSLDREGFVRLDPPY